MSTTTTPTALSSLIRRPEGALLPLLKKADQLRGLNDTLSVELDSSLTRHCRAVNLRGTVLVLAVDSAVWATRMRFQTGEILSRLRAAGWPGLASVEVIIRPQDKDLELSLQRNATPIDHRPPAAIRQRIAAVLAGDADTLPADIARRLLNLVNSYTKSI